MGSEMLSQERNGENCYSAAAVASAKRAWFWFGGSLADLGRCEANSYNSPRKTGPQVTFNVNRGGESDWSSSVS